MDGETKCSLLRLGGTGVLLAVLAYPLSMGPAFWFHRALGIPSARVFDAVYTPVVWVLERCPDWVDDLWDFYFRHWV